MGRVRRGTFIPIVSATLVLLGMSMWRQSVLARSPRDPLVPYVAYGTYTLLLAAWLNSIRARIAQQSTRRFIMWEAGLMFCGATLRFLQSTILSDSVGLLRQSGYVLVAILIPLPLLGWYAALGLGHPDDYRVRWEWQLLDVPAAALIALVLTDHLHQLVFSRLPSETEPNLFYHPGPVSWLIAVWYVVFVLGRLALMLARGRKLGITGRRLGVPFALFACGVMVTLPYFTTSFAPNADYVEFFARLYFAEVAIWESCMLTGMIPTNTGYIDVLHSSTLDLQIIRSDGTLLAGSSNAPPVGPGEFERLTQGEALEMGDGRMVYAQEVDGAWCVWCRDLSPIRSVIKNLGQTNEQLEQHRGLLTKELAVRTEKALVGERTYIHATISRELKGQLAQLDAILNDLRGIYREAAPTGACTADEERLFAEIYELGSSIKRRCMAQLAKLDEGSRVEGVA